MFNELFLQCGGAATHKRVTAILPVVGRGWWVGLYDQRLHHVEHETATARHSRPTPEQVLLLAWRLTIVFVVVAVVFVGAERARRIAAVGAVIVAVEVNVADFVGGMHGSARTALAPSAGVVGV